MPFFVLQPILDLVTFFVYLPTVDFGADITTGEKGDPSCFDHALCSCLLSCNDCNHVAFQLICVLAFSLSVAKQSH